MPPLHRRHVLAEVKGHVLPRPHDAGLGLWMSMHESILAAVWTLSRVIHGFRAPYVLRQSCSSSCRGARHRLGRGRAWTTVMAGCVSKATVTSRTPQVVAYPTAPWTPAVPERNAAGTRASGLRGKGSGSGALGTRPNAHKRRPVFGCGWVACGATFCRDLQTDAAQISGC